jgi:predicted DNA-binding antitoxin AbrB/MazE fold protein
VWHIEIGKKRQVINLCEIVERWTVNQFVGYAYCMIVHTDAIYENGVLRPLMPLSLNEHQVVSLSISTDAEKTAAGQETVRDHSAFLNSYTPEDEGLYDDYSAG